MSGCNRSVLNLCIFDLGTGSSLLKELSPPKRLQVATFSLLEFRSLEMLGSGVILRTGVAHVQCCHCKITQKSH